MQYLSRNLVLVSPNQTEPAAEIREVQRYMNVRIDGVYGAITANAIKKWKYRVGFHEKFVNHNLTTSESQWLFGTRTLTPQMRIRARARAATNPPKPVGERAMEEMVAWARAGYRETGNNYVPQLSKLAADLGLSISYQKMGWPWCALATGLSGLKVGSQVYKQLFAGMFNAKLPLYVPQIYAYAQSGLYGLRVIGASNARPGDLVVFNWDGGVPDHIGRLVAKRDSNTIVTVEGNTSPSNSGSQSNGDGVYTRIRYLNTVHGFIREEN